jgi:predicted nuclease of predicted toxin-antitoxin system
MADLLLDHNVSRAYVSLLTAEGHDVRMARDERLDRADDGAILLYAAERGWTIVTHNRDDFWLLHRAWHHWSSAWRVTQTPRHVGILVLPQREHLPHQQLANRVAEFLTDHADWSNQFHEWTVLRGWTRDAFL